jgi:acyl carrier protein
VERHEIQKVVVRIVSQLAADVGLPSEAIGPQSSLIETAGLDSLRFVDLTVELEDALGIDAFPMQEWADSQRDLASSTGFSVASLIDECLRVLTHQRDCRESPE